MVHYRAKDVPVNKWGFQQTHCGKYLMVPDAAHTDEARERYGKRFTRYVVPGMCRGCSRIARRAGR